MRGNVRKSTSVININNIYKRNIKSNFDINIIYYIFFINVSDFLPHYLLSGWWGCTILWRKSLIGLELWITVSKIH